MTLKTNDLKRFPSCIECALDSEITFRRALHIVGVRVEKLHDALLTLVRIVDLFDLTGDLLKIPQLLAGHIGLSGQIKPTK